MRHVKGYVAPAKTAGELLQRIKAVPAAKRCPGLFSSVEMGPGEQQSLDLCVDLWNHRQAVAHALRLVQALRENPTSALRLTLGSCTCGVKVPELKHHAESCVYAAACAALELGKDQ